MERRTASRSFWGDPVVGSATADQLLKQLRDWRAWAESSGIAAGHVYAAYGGVYVLTIIVWLWTMDGVRPTVWDVTDSLVALCGMAIIMFAPSYT